MRAAATIAITLAVAGVLYSWRAFTFAVWVNAAMLSHSHPLLAVAGIEILILGLAALGAWKLIEALRRWKDNSLTQHPTLKNWGLYSTPERTCMPELAAGPAVWSVLDSDNYECGGIVSLHWSKEGAMKHAHALVEKEDKYALMETGSRMRLTGPAKWTWTHRTIEVEQAEVKP